LPQNGHNFLIRKQLGLMEGMLPILDTMFTKNHRSAARFRMRLVMAATIEPQSRKNERGAGRTGR